MVKRHMRHKFKDLWKVNEQLALIVLILKPVSTLLVWFNLNFIKLGPNMVTTCSILISAFSGYFFLDNNVVLGALFFSLARLFDCIDGKTARAMKKTSKFGAFFDNYAGGLTFLFVSLGLTFGQFIHTNNITWLFLSPILLFLILFHPLQSSILALKLGRLPSENIKKSTKKKDGILGNIENFQRILFNKGLLEPFHSEDAMYLIFFFGPLISLFFDILVNFVIFIMCLMVLKEIFWFIYYRSLLKKADNI